MDTVSWGEKEFEIQHADQYPQLLREKGSVVADFNERKAEILAKSQAKATALGGVADIEESCLKKSLPWWNIQMY